MTIYFSASQKGFYSSEVSEPNSIPDDVIEISESQHQEMLFKLNHELMDIVVTDSGDIVYTGRPNEPVSFQRIRNKRNKLLAQSDFTQIPDWPGNKTAWAVYRQALRDIPQTYTSADNVVWPNPPA